jgi:hypothetical protein
MVAVVAPPKNCLFCELQFVSVPATEGILYHAKCPRCGSYAASYGEHDAIKSRLGLHHQDRPVFSQWIYEQNRLGEVPTIKSSDIAVIASRRKFSYADRVRRLLVFLHEATVSPGENINIIYHPLQAALQTFDQNYIQNIAGYLRDEGWATVGLPGPVGPDGQTQMVSLTPRGIMQAEEWSRSYTASTHGFVAMWFDQQMGSAWEEGFRPAIEAAGYAPQRIDRKEHVNKICDEIIAEIRRSRFVVADFTGQRGGVYYEAGYASGRDIPVILTCHKGDFEKIHFDSELSRFRL